MTIAPFDGLRTAADLSFEPDDGLRRELHDGVVYVVPPPSDRHSLATLAAYRTLFAEVPQGITILHDVGVHVGLRRLYVPDLLAVHVGTPFHDNGYEPGGVLFVLEAVSPSSVTMDRITKPVVYAEQQIPFFWRLDELGNDGNGPLLEAFRLDPTVRQYVPDAKFGPGQHGSLDHPWPVKIDMSHFTLPSR